MSRLTSYAGQLATAAPVWHELQSGVGRLPEGARRRALETYLHSVVKATIPILAYDERAAEWHARERVRLAVLGTPMPFVDGQIAAVAHVNRLVLVTANTRDFSVFEGLVLEDWSA